MRRRPAHRAADARDRTGAGRCSRSTRACWRSALQGSGVSRSAASGRSYRWASQPPATPSRCFGGSKHLGQHQPRTHVRVILIELETDLPTGVLRIDRAPHHPPRRIERADHKAHPGPIVREVDVDLASDPKVDGGHAQPVGQSFRLGERRPHLLQRQQPAPHVADVVAPVAGVGDEGGRLVVAERRAHVEARHEGAVQSGDSRATSPLVVAGLLVERLAAAGDRDQVVHEVCPAGRAAQEPPGRQPSLMEHEPAAVLNRRELPAHDGVAAGAEPLEREKASAARRRRCGPRPDCRRRRGTSTR